MTGNMPPLLPHRFLFRYRIPVRHVAALPRRGQKLVDLPEECRIPDFSALDGAAGFADLRAAWNANGVGFSLHVAGKSGPPSCDMALPAESDGLQIWLDTRNTQTIHRASRFCHYFCFSPQGGGRDGNAPTACQLPVPRAREDAPLMTPENLRVRSKTTRDGYRLEAWLASEQLQGFEPEDLGGNAGNPLVGFYYCIRDAELGEQFLSVGRDFPFASDPSLWATLELIRA